MTGEVSQLLVGPQRHGVVQYGLELHDALTRNDFRVECRWLPDISDVGTAARARHVHLQFTDRLFGPDPASAAAAFVAVTDDVRACGGIVTATLHDVPQPSDGTHFAARVQAYRDVTASCDAVVVNSNHERDLLAENRIDADRICVIPLPISVAGPDPVRPRPARLTLGLFGFIYPGKGHEEVLAAARGLASDVEVHAIGVASAGHEQLVDELRRTAARQRRTFRVTGYVTDDDLTAALREVTVPIAAHRHISASGSLNSWLAAGRRPLAPSTRYTTEIEQRNPGSLHFFPDDPAGLHTAIREALADPDSTWLPTPTTLRPSPADVAAAYGEMFRAMRC